MTQSQFPPPPPPQDSHEVHRIDASVPPVYPQASPPRKSRKKWYLGGAAAVLVIAALGAAGSQDFKDGVEAGVEATLPKPTAAMTPTPEPVPTATLAPTPVPTVAPTPEPNPIAVLQGQVTAALASGDCDALTDIAVQLVDEVEVDDALLIDGASEALTAAIDCMGPDSSGDQDKIGITKSFTDDTACEVDVTPTAVKVWQPGNTFIRPGKNKRFVTLLVTVKPTAGAGDCYGIGYLYFGIESLDGYAYEPDPAWRDPQLPYDSDISAKNGRAIKGWVTFELPKSLKRGVVTYGDAEWTFSL